MVGRWKEEDRRDDCIGPLTAFTHRSCSRMLAGASHFNDGVSRTCARNRARRRRLAKSRSRVHARPLREISLARGRSRGFSTSRARIFIAEKCKGAGGNTLCDAARTKRDPGERGNRYFEAEASFSSRRAIVRRGNNNWSPPVILAGRRGDWWRGSGLAPTTTVAEGRATSGAGRLGGKREKARGSAWARRDGR